MAEYYVAINGSDSNSGTIDNPWKTWKYAFEKLSAGDTLYIRGGTYYAPNNGAAFDKITITGTSSNNIIISNYLDEIPILDFSNVTTDTHSECFGLVTSTQYVKFIGLILQNFRENDSNDFMNMWHMEGSNTIIDRCVVRYGGGRGFRTWETDEFYFYNCDSYDHVDTLSPSLPGNDGYGFSHSGASSSDKIYYYNCRAWDCGDDGFTAGSPSHVEYHGCWSFNNGKLEGGGHGFKLNRSNSEVNSDIRIMYNCIGAYNKVAGFTSNDQGYYSIAYELYNNLFYHNGYQGNPYWGYGGVLFDTESSQLYEENRELRNNIAYDNERGNIYLQSGGAYTHSNNTWDGGVTVSAADFVALPSSAENGIALLKSARQSDGSLPDLGNYFQLAEDSDLIDAGIDVGLPYNGNAPDIGAFESDGGSIPDPPPSTNSIIADHTIVDKYNEIPQQYIDEVKKMWLSYAGQSHSEAIRDGLDALELIDSRFQVNVTEDGTPEAYTSSHLRASRATWGSYYNSSGWIYNYSTYSWFVQDLGISRTKAGIQYCHDHDLTYGALGFGWCWDSEIDSQTEFQRYIYATQEYVDYCNDNDIPTAILFTTGTVDGGEDTFGETGYNKHLGYELMRNYVSENEGLYLFDYADILCVNDAGDVNTTSWDGHTYPILHPDNNDGTYTGHIGMNGAIRLAKAMWWLLARIAGWDGNTTTVSTPTVITLAVTDITTNSVIAGGNVTDDGGAITHKGICWNTTGNPTVSDSSTLHGITGEGTYNIEISNLDADTTYYVRAFAYNSEGLIYGDEISFDTENDSPVILTYRGVCWSTSPLPTINDASILDTGTGEGTYSMEISDLDADTTYYVRAFAYNSAGLSYGNEVSFDTLPIIELPVVTTSDVTEISNNSAIAEGNVTDDGGDTTYRGICWSTSEMPTVLDASAVDSNTGEGTYNINLTDLDADTTYYVRAFAYNSEGLSYGEQITFDTLPIIELPVVTTSDVTEISNNSAIAEGNVTDDGGAITHKGICWNTTGNPTVSDPSTLDDNTGEGIYNINMTDLDADTTYYVRAFAYNSVGLSYGNEVTFDTLSDIELPSVTTSDVTNITTNSAIFGGNVTDDGLN